MLYKRGARRSLSGVHAAAGGTPNGGTRGMPNFREGSKLARARRVVREHTFDSRTRTKVDQCLRESSRSRTYVSQQTPNISTTFAQLGTPDAHRQ